MTDEERVELSSDFKSLMQTRGFRKFLDLLEMRIFHVGNAALHDDVHSKDWWLGFLEGATGVKEEVKALIEGGEELRQEIQHEKASLLGSSEPDWEDSAV